MNIELCAFISVTSILSAFMGWCVGIHDGYGDGFKMGFSYGRIVGRSDAKGGDAE